MSKKSLWMVAGVILVVLVAVLLKNQGVSYSGLWPSFSNRPGATASPTAKPASSKGTSVPGAANYSDLVVQYEGRRIQFNKECQAIPGNMALKTGTKIMLDNRSGDARTIKVGNSTYSLKGYGYQLVTLTSPTLPQTLYLSCGSAVNVGQILLQATILQ